MGIPAPASRRGTASERSTHDITPAGMSRPRLSARTGASIGAFPEPDHARADHHHGTRRMTHNGFGRAAEHDVRDARASVGPNHDQIRRPPPRCGQNFVGGRPSRTNRHTEMPPMGPAGRSRNTVASCFKLAIIIGDAMPLSGRQASFGSIWKARIG